MLMLSFLDQSQDELIIHLIASSFPILIGWILRVLLVGRIALFTIYLIRDSIKN